MGIIVRVMSHRTLSPARRKVSVKKKEVAQGHAVQANRPLESSGAACEVLLISRSMAVLEHIGRALGRAPETHYRVTPATGLDEAVATLRAHAFAALLLAMGLPIYFDQKKLQGAGRA
jgi:hypothetical protein